jgi:hypothetical protein
MIRAEIGVHSHPALALDPAGKSLAQSAGGANLDRAAAAIDLRLTRRYAKSFNM